VAEVAVVDVDSDEIVGATLTPGDEAEVSCSALLKV